MDGDTAMGGNLEYLGQAALTWCVVGTFAGYFMGFFSKRVNLGKPVLGDMVTGLLGACVAGFPARYFIAGRLGFYVSVLTAAIGACMLTWAWRAGRHGEPRSAS